MRIHLPLLLSILFFFGNFSHPLNAQINFWQEESSKSSPSDLSPDIAVKKFRLLRLNIALFKAEWSKTPKLTLNKIDESNQIWLLPLPDGGWGRFKVIENQLLTPDFAKLMPEIKTFNAIGLDDPQATAKLDWTPQGFHGLVLSPQGDIYIDPYSSQNQENYIVYYKKDFNKPLKFGQKIAPNCATEMNDQFLNTITITKENGSKPSERPSGSQLRSYRLAMAATGEYTQFHGGTVANAQAAIVTAINRINGIYEKELAITLQLINNTSIIFTNGTTDPFSNNDGATMLNQNQNLIDSNIGAGNYDIGHVFSTGGGGIAFLGCICQANAKAQGVTGLDEPINDPFYVDFVAHEIGHQFGARHTFNSISGGCNGNRSSNSSYEPGSGTTIMAYAGICSGDNIQFNSDPYFHTRSFEEIFNYAVNGLGNGCANISNTGNRPPVITLPSGGFTIPINTPFQLTGSATDPDNDALSYCWEQFDLGPAGSPASPSGNAPIFRSFNPTLSPTRTFPRLDDLLANTISLGEVLPNYSRSLSFRLTVRDNRSVGGLDYGTISFNVSNSAGPFVLTSPNTAVNWRAGSTKSVTWNVANTNIAPVNCQFINIRLSIDGGLTFPILLASNVTNDGSHDIVVPENITAEARIKIEAVGNIFFDISNVNFRISPSSNTAPTSSNTAITILEDGVLFFQLENFNLNYRDAENDPLDVIRVSSINIPTGARLTFQGLDLNENTIIPVVNISQIQFRPANNANGNNYAGFLFEVNDGTLYSTQKYTFSINVTSVNDVPTVTANLPLRTFPQEVEAYTIENRMLSATDVEDPASSLRFVVRGLPVNGTLKLNNQNLSVNNTFTINDLQENRITYTPNNPNADISENFPLLVRDSQGGESQQFNFTILINQNFPLNDSQVIISPNPSKDIFRISVNIVSTFRLEVEVFDVRGQSLKQLDLQKESNNFDYTLNMTNWPSGLYYLRLRASSRSFIKRIVKF
jgi:hypothetical protein